MIEIGLPFYPFTFPLLPFPFPPFTFPLSPFYLSPFPLLPFPFPPFTLLLVSLGKIRWRNLYLFRVKRDGKEENRNI